jgi:signal transduction histidine kinase
VSDSSTGNESLLLEVIAQEAIVGIIAFDSKTQDCVFINRLARETLELGFDESAFENAFARIDFKCSDLYPKSNRSNLRAFSDELIMAEGFFQDILLRKANGQVIIANVSVKNVAMGEGSARKVVMFQDITIQKKLQRELEAKQDELKNAFTQVLEQNRELMELDSAKDRFIALTTHELRTPLSAIVATAEVLELKLYESEEQKEQFIKTIHEQGFHLMDLVNDILDFAKIRAGKMEFFVEELALVPIVSKLASTFESMAVQGQVTLRVDNAPGEFKAYCDALRLKEVVSNVVNNAIKYNKVNGTVHVSFEMLEERKLLRIIVQDTGQGIPAAKLHHVFNEFETVGNVARHHKGTGLGMPISKRLMQAMGGELTLESVEGVGTSFFIDLPTEKVLAEEVYRSRADSWGDLAA